MQGHTVMRWLLCSTFLGALSIGMTTPAVTSAAQADEAVTETFRVKMKLQRDGRSLEHPGETIIVGEELSLLLTAGDSTHEVVVRLAGKGPYRAVAAYRDDGKSVLDGQLKLVKGRWAQLKSKDGKTVLSLRIDKAGARTDRIETAPDSNDPLAGL